MSVFIGFLITAFAMILYFAPTIVAHGRGNQYWRLIFLGNVLVAWTMVGWLVLMVCAYGDDKAKREANDAFKREQMEFYARENAKHKR